MNEPNIEELISFLKNSKLKEKTLFEMKDHLINYYLNIRGSDGYEENIIKNNNNNKKITDFFQKNIY